MQLKLKVRVQFTQRGFYVFHFTTVAKFNLARTFAGDSKRSGDRPLSPPRDRQQGADYRTVAYIRRTFSLKC